MAEYHQQHENSSSFWSSFTGSIAEIRKTLKTLLPDVTGDWETLQQLKLKLSALQVYATESTPLLPAYDVRRSQEELEILGKEIKDAELFLKPKKKFSFASRSSSSKVPVAPIIKKEETNIINNPDKTEKNEKEIYPPGSFVVSEKKNGTIFLSSEELKLISAYGANVQLLLKDCDNIVLSSPTIHGSVRLENMTNSKIFLGPCCTSVYLEDCKNLTVFLSCHQLRIHRSHNCQLYVRVNSHPIIEDCTGFGFAPYDISYPGIEDDIKASSLTDAHCWDNVVDFRWHRVTQSPNWRVIPLGERMRIVPDRLEGAGWMLNSIGGEGGEGGGGAGGVEGGIVGEGVVGELRVEIGEKDVAIIAKVVEEEEEEEL